VFFLLLQRGLVDIVDPDIDRYLHELASPQDPVLREMEMLAAERNFPIVGPAVGQLLYVLTRSAGALRVIELGSGFGYSAYWFARAVGPEGLVILTEHSPELGAEAHRFLERGGLDSRTRIEIGDALEIIDHVGGEFDIVFNDIDKDRYPEVLDRAAAALRPGGLLISDNMLWYGTVLDAKSDEPSARGVKQLLQLLYDAPEFATTLIPLRDGLTVSVYRA
jgi:predicted O-methyltransferase YrrM